MTFIVDHSKSQFSMKTVLTFLDLLKHSFTVSIWSLKLHSERSKTGPPGVNQNQIGLIKKSWEAEQLGTDFAQKVRVQLNTSS